MNVDKIVAEYPRWLLSKIQTQTAKLAQRAEEPTELLPIANLANVPEPLSTAVSVGALAAELRQSGYRLVAVSDGADSHSERAAAIIAEAKQ